MINYDAHSWRAHLFDIRGSMVKQIIYRVLLCVFWSALVVSLERWVYSVALPLSVHSLTGFAIGLLLVFRTNASYDRFWEGRKLWGSIVNETRNLARMSKVMIAPAASDLHDKMVMWISLFPYATMMKLRGGDNPDPVKDAQHGPLAVAAELSRIIAEARARGVVTDIQQMAIDNNVEQLVDFMGGCERIHKTPLPFAYVVHLRRALIMYCFSLPFALVDSFGWGSIPATFLVAYTFFGIEEIGVEIEDPFGQDDNDLPLEDICATIEGNVKALA